MNSKTLGDGRVSKEQEPNQVQEENRPVTPLDYCSETQKNEPLMSYFNKRQNYTVTLYLEDGNPAVQRDPSVRGSPVDQRDQQLSRSPNRVAPQNTDEMRAAETRMELPIEDEEFKYRVLAEKLRLARKGKESGSIYGQ